MTRDDVIRMAREAGLLIPSFRIGGGLALGSCTVPDFERFASIVAAAEREAYAKETKKLFAQPASSVPECPYPCGWQSLLKLAMEDGAYLARSINEDVAVTENARAVTMRMVMRLRDVLMAINNAAPETKP